MDELDNLIHSAYECLTYADESAKTEIIIDVFRKIKLIKQQPSSKLGAFKCFIKSNKPYRKTDKSTEYVTAFGILCMDGSLVFNRITS